MFYSPSNCDLSERTLQKCYTALEAELPLRSIIRETRDGVAYRIMNKGITAPGKPD